MRCVHGMYAKGELGNRMDYVCDHKTVIIDADSSLHEK